MPIQGQGHGGPKVAKMAVRSSMSPLWICM